MNTNQLQKLCSLLNLGIPVTTPEKITGGLLHTMWHLKTNGNQYAIKELNPSIMTKENAVANYNHAEKIAHTVAQSGIKTATSIEYENNSIIEIQGTFFIVFPWIEAAVLPNNTISMDHAQKIAAVLARLHTLNIKSPELHEEWYAHSDTYHSDLIERGIQSKLPYQDVLTIIKPHVKAWNGRYHTAISILKQNLVASHGDLDQKNVLWNTHHEPILIDWETTRLLNPTHEIINAAFDWSGFPVGKFNTDIFKAVIKTYKKAGGIITHQDLEAVFCGLPGEWLTWLTYNIERSLNETMPSSERQLGVEQVQQTKILTYLKHDLQLLIKSVKSLLNE